MKNAYVGFKPSLVHFTDALLRPLKKPEKYIKVRPAADSTGPDFTCPVKV